MAISSVSSPPFPVTLYSTRAGISLNICFSIRPSFTSSFKTVNRLHPILHKIYPSSDIKQALLEIEQGIHYGKICISLDPFE